jgi:predicted metal-dependent enzyme (double-stranded beta helix superfamily)
MDHPQKLFEEFVTQLREIWRTHDTDKARMSAARETLRVLAAHPAIQAHSKSWPITVGQNLLLYEDPDYHFVVNAVVRPPDYKGGVHDHADAWVLYGVVDGAESLERFARVDDASVEGFAELRLVSASRGLSGVVDLVPPFEIHAEQGASDRSAALILRSQRVVGRVMQNGYDVASKKVVKRWGPEQVPYSLD